MMSGDVIMKSLYIVGMDLQDGYLVVYGNKTAPKGDEDEPQNTFERL